VLFDGDGSLMMHVQELETIKRHGLNILIVVMNDGAYGSEVHKLRSEQMLEDGAVFGYCDFAGIARGFGLAGKTVRNLEELPKLVAEFAASGGRRGLGLPRLGQGGVADHTPRASSRWQEMSLATASLRSNRAFILCAVLTGCVHSTTPIVNPVIDDVKGWSKDAGSFLYYRSEGNERLTLNMYVEVLRAGRVPSISITISSESRREIFFDATRVHLRIGSDSVSPVSGRCDGGPLASSEPGAPPTVSSLGGCVRFTWPGQTIPNWEGARLTLDGLSIDGVNVPPLGMGFRNATRYFTYIGGA
jgi:hypothetical protein